MTEKELAARLLLRIRAVPTVRAVPTGGYDLAGYALKLDQLLDENLLRRIAEATANEALRQLESY